MKINFKSALQTIVFVLIFGFIFYYVIPDIFSPSEPDIPPSITSMTTTIPAYIPSSSILTAIVQTTTPISPVEPIPQSTELISKDFKWEYDGSEWTWNLQIPKSLYDYYKALPRSPTPNYSIYVTHPLADAYINSLTAKIQQSAQEKGYSEFQTIELAVTFVQSLPYTSDLVTTGFDNYARYPIETLVANGGDCEDTAILTASLIRSLGYGTVLIVFPGTPESPGHCAVGVKGDKGIFGSYYTYDDNKYYYIETTSSGWEIGEIPEDYKDVSAKIYPMIPVPILTEDWATEVKGTKVELKVTVKNLGSAIAKGVYVYAGFDAGNNQCWNHQESPLFDLDVDGSVVVTLYLTPPLGKHTRWVIQIVYDGYAVDESYSTWFDT